MLEFTKVIKPNVLYNRRKMSQYRNHIYFDEEFIQIYDREIKVVGADVIAGLLHVHCGKPLQVIIIKQWARASYKYLGKLEQ